MIKKFILLILTIIGTIPAFSQSNHNDPDSVTKRRSAFFVSYMKNTFPDFKLTISQATLEKLPEDFLTIDNNILCDKTNKLDRMSFGISSVSVLKIKNKMIVASKSMKVDDVLNGIENLFEEM